MYLRIIVAIDEGFMSSRVLTAAVDLAQKYDARLLICHAIDETIFAHREVEMMLPNSVGKAEYRLRLGAQGFLVEAAAQARAAGIEAEVKVVESERKSVPDLIAEAASDWQADLIVAGTHGRRGVERFFVGSVAEKLVRKTEVSLLLVRGE